MPFAAFTGAIVALVLVGLAISGARKGPMTFRAALVSSAAWIGLAIVFGLWIALRRGQDAALAYFAAYLTEESLSLDNMVVFMAIFARFGLPTDYQERVLSWGVVGASVMRAAARFAGVELLERLSWIRYAFGALLIIGSLPPLRSHRPPGPACAGTP